jgi:hypothetical protein
VSDLLPPECLLDERVTFSLPVQMEIVMKGARSTETTRIRTIIAGAAIISLASLCGCPGGYDREYLEVRPCVVPLTGLNTPYDDFNSAGPASISADQHFVYSTNVGSAGSQFDIWEGEFHLHLDHDAIEKWEPEDYPVVANKIAPFMHAACNSAANEIGPNFLVTGDSITGDRPVLDLFPAGALYLFSSDRNNGQQDIFFHDNDTLRQLGINGPKNDCYPSFRTADSTLYFCSNRAGSFDIYQYKKGPGQNLTSFLTDTDTTRVSLCTALNSAKDDKCPYILGNIMVFVSNRDSKDTTFDIYFSRFEAGVWRQPAKLPDMEYHNQTMNVNTAHNEYRPILSKAYADYAEECYVMLFSSDRPRYTRDTRTDYDLQLAIIPIKYLN